MKKRYLFVLIGILCMSIFFAGCIIPSPEEFFGTGLRAILNDEYSRTSQAVLDIYNEDTGRNITSVKSYHHDTSSSAEPIWAVEGLEHIPGDIIQIISGSSGSLIINSEIGAAPGDYVWIRIETSNGDYCVVRFVYETNDYWDIYVYND